MNILLLTDKLTMGGAENYFCKLENGLSHESLTFYYAAAVGELYPSIKLKENFTTLSRKNHFFNMWKLSRLIKEKNIEVIHANSLRMILYAWIIRMLTRGKFVILYTKHNVTVLEKFAPQIFTKLMNNTVEKIITVSDFEKNHLLDLGVQSEKIRTIYNGVSLQAFPFEKKKKRYPKKIGILARVSEEKNHRLFLEIADSCKKNADLLFYIAGDGPDFLKIQAMVEKMGLTNKVRMLGAVSDPARFIKEMDVLLLTSHREVFPMVLLEAMAVGTPIISIDRGGIKEAIQDGVTGFLVPEHSAEQFGVRIAYVLRNDLKRMQVTKEARRKVEASFSLDQMVQSTLEEYLQIYSKKIQLTPIDATLEHEQPLKGFRGI